MSFWPDVKPGDKIVRSSLLENQIRHLVNAANGFSDNKASGLAVQPCIITGYNAAGTSDSVTFKAGQPVEIGTEALVGDAVPFKSISKDNPDHYAILLEDMGENGFARAVVSGYVTTKPPASGTGNFLSPKKLTDSQTEWWTRGGSGVRILWSSSGTDAEAMVLIGGGSGEISLGVITTRPTGGFGPATYKKITLHADGTWEAAGSDIAIIIPEF